MLYITLDTTRTEMTPNITYTDMIKRIRLMYKYGNLEDAIYNICVCVRVCDEDTCNQIHELVILIVKNDCFNKKQQVDSNVIDTVFSMCEKSHPTSYNFIDRMLKTFFWI